MSPAIRQRACFYNDNEPFVAQWLRNLIAAGELPAGDVDERSITQLKPEDVRYYEQAHFFAGIGGWPIALKLAGWTAGRTVHTCSPPCQPFSVAGQGRANLDERNLWCEAFRLIRVCRPSVCLGEQVPGAIRFGWLDRVFADLESEGYACGAMVLPACAVGAPHIRQRIYWVGIANESGHAKRMGFRNNDATALREGAGEAAQQTSDGLGPYGLAVTEHAERRSLNLDREDGRDGADGGRQETHGELGACGQVCRGDRGLLRKASGLGIADRAGLQSRESVSASVGHGHPAFAASYWSDSKFIACADHKTRRIPLEPALFPLAPNGAHGNRVGILRASGNSLCVPLATVFVQAVLQALSAPAQ